ncbi:MAG: PTS sugar transporter subunit IIA [Rhodocyclaceae bacterium]|nr:PTS sugar transporter subunit IIA [Rhodocyclaceae bacterium]
MHFLGRVVHEGDFQAVLDWNGAKEQELFSAGARLAADKLRLPAAALAAALSQREAMGSTAVGAGVALPHARMPGIGRPVAVYIRPHSPVYYDGAPDGKPVTDVLILLMPADTPDDNIAILGEAARRLNDAEFRRRLSLCDDEEEVLALFAAEPLP